jgi:hypothetical protein
MFPSLNNSTRIPTIPVRYSTTCQHGKKSSKNNNSGTTREGLAAVFSSDP